MRRETAALLMCVALATPGCQSLTINADDSGGTKFGKVVGRTLLGVSTLGISELYYARKRKLDSWLGHHVNELIASWGPPSVATEGYGGIRFFTWYRTGRYTTPGKVQTYCDDYGNCSSTVNPPKTHTIQSRVTFTVDSSGRIVAYSSQ